MGYLPLDGTDLPQVRGPSIQLSALKLLRHAERQAAHQDVEGAGQLQQLPPGLIWVTQLLIFHASVLLEKSELGTTLERIEEYSGDY